MRKQFSKLALVATIGLALALIFSCSSGGGGSSDPVVKREKIVGVSQKGPFAKGATVTIYELDEDMNVKGKPITGKTIDDKGNFEVAIKGGKISPYIIVEVSGSYANEVSGKPSTSAITLKSVANVSNKDRVNINVLTHLETDKVLKLTRSGTKFDDAKKEAQTQVLNALGISESIAKNSEDMAIFGGSSSDEALLLASILLQGNRTTEDVASLLDAISSEIKNSDDGILSTATKSDVDNGLVGVNIDKVKENLHSLEPTANVPDLGDLLKPKEPSSSSDVSSSSSSLDVEISSSSLNPVELSSSSESIAVPSSSSSEPVLSSSSSEPVPSSSSVVPSSSSSLGVSSSSSVGLSSSSAGGSCKDGQGRDYFCEWGTPPHVSDDPGCYAIIQEADKTCDTMVSECKRWGYLYVNSTVAAGGTCDGIPISLTVYGEPVTYQGETYQTVVIGTQTWMARNLNYAASGSECYNKDPADCAIYGRLYDWETAKNVCPSGWHLPSDAEWDDLGTEVGDLSGTKLKSATGWKVADGYTGTNEFGFSALPGGYGYAEDGGYGHAEVGEVGYWWTASENDGMPYCRNMHYNNKYLGLSCSELKSSLLSVRCLQELSALG